MHRRISASIKKFPILAAISVFLLMILAMILVSQQRYRMLKGIEKRELNMAASEVKNRIETVFQQAQRVSSALNFIVNKYGISDDFNEVASQLLKNNRSIDAIELEQGDKIIHRYSKNKDVDFADYKLHSDSIQAMEAKDVIRREEMTFSGPFELKNGEKVIHGRLPIFVSNNFWGSSEVVIRLNTLFKQAGLDTNQNIYTYQVSRINPKTRKEEFLLENPDPSQKKYPVDLSISQGNLKIYVSFSKRSAILTRPPIVIFGLLLSIVAGLFTYYMVRRPMELKKLVEEKTRDLIEKDKQFNRALHEAQEKERLQISMELHDHIKQILAASMVTLEHVRVNSEKQDVVNEAVDRVRRYLREANEDIRKISHRLAPSVDSLELEEKIKLLANTMNINQHMKIEFNMFAESESINNALQLALYRILQEQLTNIIKYADASFVAISMETCDNELVMHVRDNGKGFDLKQKNPGIGLENIRRRASTLNGEMEIQSSPGNGCELVVRFPLN